MPKENEFLDDIEAAEAEAFAEEETEITDEAAEIDALRTERDDYKDKFMRALADAENSRKRADKQRREAEQYGGSKLSRDMLSVFDNLKRAMDAVTDEQREQMGAMIEGIELTLRELLNVFKKHGIELISPEIGDKFDPQLHEAMFEAPVPNTVAGEIIQVSADGFMLHDRLLRPAQGHQRCAAQRPAQQRRVLRRAEPDRQHPADNPHGPLPEHRRLLLPRGRRPGAGRERPRPLVRRRELDSPRRDQQG